MYNFCTQFIYYSKFISSDSRRNIYRRYYMFSTLKRKLLVPMLITATVVSTLPITVQAATNSSATLSKDVFDADYYYNTYPDLQTAIGHDEKALLKHYLNYGMKEGRSGSSQFNVLVYRDNYSDLSSSYGNDYLSYCYHYMNYGKSEGRNACAAINCSQSSSNTTTESASVVSSSVVSAPVISGNVLGTYTTYYDGTIPRATNVSLAASRINGIVLEPGASFSFSAAVLPRTAENGYVVATVFANKRISQGRGGGICQVSSTLYAAMMNAGIPATERYPHSMPVSYMPAGMDATISGNVKDLKFDNTFDYSIQLSATADNTTGTLTVSILKKE